MKITKRQLRRIIKEEKQKLLNEIINRKGIDVKLQGALDAFKYSMEKELVKMLSTRDRQWRENPAIVSATADMLDDLKEIIINLETTK
jgi:hypothetical protein